MLIFFGWRHEVHLRNIDLKSIYNPKSGLDINSSMLPPPRDNLNPHVYLESTTEILTSILNRRSSNKTLYKQIASIKISPWHMPSWTSFCLSQSQWCSTCWLDMDPWCVNSGTIGHRCSKSLFQLHMVCGEPSRYLLWQHLTCFFSSWTWWLESNTKHSFVTNPKPKSRIQIETLAQSRNPSPKSQP